MTDELQDYLLDSILFMRDAMALHKGALVRHLRSTGKKSVEYEGYKFSIKAIAECEGCKSPARDDLRIERVKEG